MKRLLFAILALCVCSGATTTVTGNMNNLGAVGVTGGFMRFWLRGCAGNQPRVAGQGLIAPTLGGVYYFDLAANASGAVSGNLYSNRDVTGTGNGEIECGGSMTATWYGMQAFFGGKGGPETAIIAKNTGSFDISNVTPITVNPVITAPTGDSTYCRLDGGNCGFTGPVTSNSSFTATTINAKTINTNKLESVLYADQAAGADCGAKINTQVAALSGPGEIWVNNACGLTSSTAVVLAANQILRFIQPGTYNFPTISGTNGAGIYGSGTGVILKATSSASAVNFISATGGSAPSTVLLNSNSNEGSNVIALVAGGVATLGFVAGDIYQLQDTASPIHQQVGRILSISGDTLTTDDPNAFSFTTANTAFIYKIVSPVKGFIVSNFAVDSSLLSNTGSAAISLPFCFGCRVENIQVIGSGSGTALIEASGYQNVIHDLNVQASGGAIQAAVTLDQQGRMQVSNVQVNHTNPSAFGMLLGNDTLSEFTNVSIGTQETSGGGRGFKTLTASYNLFTNLESDNAIGGFNGIDVTLGSSHNRFVNCVALNNATNGIITFADGGGNQFNTFVNCTSKFNAGNAFTNGASDNNTEIIGGEYGDARAAASIISVSAVSFTMVGARIWDDNGSATAGMSFGTTGVSSLNVIGNNFSGLPIDITLAGSNLTKSNFINNQTPDGNTHNSDTTNNWVGNIGDGPGVTSGAGAPAGNCPVGSLYLNSTAGSTSTVMYVCQPANTWTAVTVP